MHGSDDTSLTLAARIAQGDPDAETELVAAFASRVYAMAVVRTRNHEASRDLAQDVLWAVVRALRDGQLRDTSRLAAFVCGTARNLINNYVRSEVRARHVADRAGQSWSASPKQLAYEQERLFIVREAVGKLDAGDREIVTLTLVDGLKPGEIAERLGLSSDVVRQRKVRAIRKVIAILTSGSQT
jgi:RNA polymerase sigma-70 factor (ECF subfamily)